jgi:pimeloyl-ACP methyl ester carboxylesterase
MWRAPLAPLRDRLTALAPDFPGHGGSGPWPEGCDVHDTATEIAHALLPDGAHVIGHSFGATVALRLALEAPDRVARLTLVEPVLFAAAEGTDAARDHEAADAHFRAACAGADFACAAWLFNRTWGGIRWDDLTADQQLRMIGAMPFIVASQPALWNDTKGLLAPGRLGALTAPTALIRGADSPPVIAAIQSALAARLPHAAEHVIDRAGHMVPLTHPKEMAALIAA